MARAPFLICSFALALAACGGSDSDTTRCGTGTARQGSECLPIVCDTGFELKGNDCVAITCDTGQVLQGSACVAITCDTGFRLEGNDCVAITCEAGYALQGNDCVDVDECAPPPVVFEKTSFSSAQDCITPEVCITRGDQWSIYNALSDPYERTDCDGATPSGTLWALGRCAAVIDDDFGPFLSEAFASCGPPSVLDVPACLKVGDRYFDVVFDKWGASGSGGSVGYRRTEAVCGAGIVCVNTPGSHSCECAPGFAMQDGQCVDVDECAAATDGCDASAACVNVPGSYYCACPTPVSFTKSDYGAEQDCLASDVCLTRADQGPIYNALRDPAPEGRVPNGSPIPTGTLWALGECGAAAPSWFGAFLTSKFANDDPTSIVGVPGCLLAGDLRFDIQFQSWTSSAQGGGFSYVRSDTVEPGVACPAPL